MFTFGNRSLMTTSVAPFTVFEVHEKLEMFSSAAFFFVPEIIKRDKYSGKHFDLTNFYCEEFAERSETTCTSA